MKFLGTYLHVLFFISIILLGFVVRLYRFDNPVADWHSWRQADTSSVSRNFVKYGFDLLHPRMNNISNVQSGLENPQGYFYAEFPLYNAAQAGLYKAFGWLTIEEWGRLVTIVMSLLGSVFLFLFVRKRNKIAAWFVFIFSIFLPYNIYYGRVILPDTSMVAMLVGGIWAFDHWIEGISSFQFQISNFKWFVLSILFTATALLLKPYAIFYSLVFIVMAYKQFRWRLIASWQLWTFAILAIAPLAWWRWYMLAYPEGIPANLWLLNGNGIRFRPAFFRWIFYERITKLISGFVNALFIALGILGISKIKKDVWIFLSFGISAFLYLCIVATGNVQHDYYQIVIMPAVALFMGFGAWWFVEAFGKLMPKQIAYILVGVIIMTGFYLSWQQVKDYFNINNPAIVEAGKAVDMLTPKNAKVLAPYDGDSSFLYQTNRQGWASYEHDLSTLISMGAEYLVEVHPSEQDVVSLTKQYNVTKQTQDYIIIKLQ